MRIIVFGATGQVGSRTVNEAVLRGHTVTGVVRDETKLKQLPDDVQGLVLDISDDQAVAAAIAGTELVISALRPPKGHEATLPALTRSILHGSGEANVPVFVVGGAANLLLPDDRGVTVLSAPDFLPVSLKPIATACFLQYQVCAETNNANWVYFSPPANLSPGERTGKFNRGSDILLVNEEGNSEISMEDFAVAILDEAEISTPSTRRVTVAY